MKAKALLLGTLLSAFLLVVAACQDNGTETPAAGDQTPTAGNTTEPTATVGGSGTATPGIGTQSPGVGTAEPGVGTVMPGTTQTPGIGTVMPGATQTPGIGTVMPGATQTPGIGTVQPTASPSGTAVPLGAVLFVPLEEMNSSGESGAAIIVPMGDTTLVAVGLETSTDTTADAAIFAGPCENLGDLDTVLASVAESTSLTILTMPADNLMNQDLSIALFNTGGTAADAIACGDIP